MRFFVLFEVVGGGGAGVGGLEVGLEEFEVTLEDGGGGVSHEVHEGDEVDAVAEGFDGECATEVVDFGFGDSGGLGAATDDLAEACWGEGGAGGGGP